MVADNLRLACGHRMHGACLADWLKSHQTCPICRATTRPILTPALLTAHISDMQIELDREAAATRRSLHDNLARKASKFEAKQRALRAIHELDAQIMRATNERELALKRKTSYKELDNGRNNSNSRTRTV